MKDKTVLITGITGSFGKAMVKRLLKTDVKQIIGISRNENNQYDMKKEFNDSRLKFILGDICNYNDIQQATMGIDYVFHSAAMKQLPLCEEQPIKAFEVNVQGSINVIKASVQNKVKKVICLSTDKAVYPISTLGQTKALMEKVALANTTETECIITRYGNVMRSNGSVIPLFESLDTLTITDPNMTRFLMSLEDAIELVLYAFNKGKQGDIFVMQSNACTIKTLAEAICMKQRKEKEIVIIGNKGNEKVYETLVSKEEMVHAEELINEKYSFYRINKEIKGNLQGEYNSGNAEQLNAREVVEIL